MQNSRKKLKFMKFYLKTQNFQRGESFYTIFIDRYFQKQENCNDIVKILRFFGKLNNIFPKTREKNSKLKEKTQRLGGLVLSHPPKWCQKKSLS